MLSRIFKFSPLMALAFVFVMTSCQKENLEELTTENFTIQSENDDQNRRNGERGERNSKCFTTVFPITIDFSDGTSATVADKEEAKAAKATFNEANPDATERPTIAYPYDVMLKDSTLVTITSDEELAALKETCGSDDNNRGRGNNRDQGDRGDRGGRNSKCFTTVFPITINFSDGTSATVADKEDAKAAKATFNEANPDATEKPTIAYPYDVALTDGTIATVTSDEDVAALKESCEGDEENN